MLLLALWLTLLSPQSSLPGPISWLGGPFPQARAQAIQSGKPILVDVYATWCAPCKAMDREIWSSKEGKEIARDRIAYRVDFDSPEGQEVKHRFRVISLPTVLFLRADGTEVDRVVGYEKREEWLAQSRRYVTGASRAEELERAAEKNPGDTGALFALGEFVLQRGEETRGIGLLEKVLTLDPGNEKGFSDDALFVLGRYHTRVMESPGAGAVYWKRLWEEYPGSELAPGALYWLLVSRENAKRLPEGVAETRGLLESHPAAPAYLSVASFLRERPAYRTEALALVRRGLKLEPADADLLALAAQTCLALDRPGPAKTYAERALRSDPENEVAREILAKISSP